MNTLRMKPSKFEQAIFEWIASHVDDPALRSQLLGADISEREHTGVGCYSWISAPGSGRPISRSPAPGGPLTGPDFHSSTVEHGGGTLLWFTDGVADLLEIFSYGDHFPQDHSELADFNLQDNDAEPGQ